MTRDGYVYYRITPATLVGAQRIDLSPQQLGNGGAPRSDQRLGTRRIVESCGNEHEVVL
jgi:hypothetical protein